MFWNLFPPRGGGRWPLSGLLSEPGKRLFSQLLVTSVQSEGEGAPGLWDAFQAAEKSQQRETLVVSGGSPRLLSPWLLGTFWS